MFSRIRYLIQRLVGSQLRKNMFASLLGTVTNLLVIAVSYPVYLHYLGYEKYGLWLVLATVLNFAQLGMLGVDFAILKLVAEEYGKDNIRGIQSYVTTAIILLSLLGLIPVVSAILFREEIVSFFKLSGDNAELVSWLLPYVGILSCYVFIVQIFNATLSGLGRMDLANYIQCTSRIAMLAISIICILLGKTVESLLIANTLSYIIMHSLSMWFCYRVLNRHIFSLHALDFRKIRRLLHYGGPIVGGNLLNMFFAPFNRIIIARYVGVSSIPIYDIAYNGAFQVRSLIEVIFRPFLPEVSRISVNRDLGSLEKVRMINRKAMKIITSIGGVMYAVVFMCAAPLLQTWLGQRFDPSIPSIFRVMVVGTFLSLVGVPAYYTLLGLGKAKYCMLSNLIQGSANVMVVVVFILIAGHLSIHVFAWSTLLGMAVSTAFILTRKRSVEKTWVLASQPI